MRRKQINCESSGSFSLFDGGTSDKDNSGKQKTKRQKITEKSNNEKNEVVKQSSKHTVHDNKKESKSQITSKQKSNIKKIDITKKRGYWKKYGEHYPENYVPCEFYVNCNGEIKTANGYRTKDGGIVTDEPYIMFVLRHKYNNLYFHEIQCELSECNNEFPSCQLCSKKKDKR